MAAARCGFPLSGEALADRTLWTDCRIGSIREAVDDRARPGARKRHEAVVAALSAKPDDPKRLDELLDATQDAVRDLGSRFGDETEPALATATASIAGPQPDPNAVSLGLDELQERGERFSREVLEHRRKTEGKRQEIEPDADRLRSLRRVLQADTVDPSGGAVPAVIAQVRRQREAATTAASAAAAPSEERLARIEARQKTATR